MAPLPAPSGTCAATPGAPLAAPGTLVVVTGPSGAGKDSLMAWLAAHWPRAPGWPALHLARRTVTRAAAASGEVAHECVDVAGFAQLQAQGLLGMAWQAHGLSYGIRHSELAPLAQGACVLVNGSRAHVAQALAQHPGLVELCISAPPDTLRQRLLARQRDNPADVQARLARNAAVASMGHPQQVCVANGGALATAGALALAGLAQRWQLPAQTILA